MTIWTRINIDTTGTLRNIDNAFIGRLSGTKALAAMSPGSVWLRPKLQCGTWCGATRKPSRWVLQKFNRTCWNVVSHQRSRSPFTLNSGESKWNRDCCIEAQIFVPCVILLVPPKSGVLLTHLAFQSDPVWAICRITVRPHGSSCRLSDYILYLFIFLPRATTGLDAWPNHIVSEVRQGSKPATNVGYGREWSSGSEGQPARSLKPCIECIFQETQIYPNLSEDHLAEHLWIWIFHVQFLKAASTWPDIPSSLLLVPLLLDFWLVHGSVSFLPQIWVGWTFT